MTPAPTSIQCKTCARILATASPDGLVSGPLAEGCSTCAQFEELHDAVKKADEAYAPLMGKGDKHRGKQAALAETTRARLMFGNYLLAVEDGRRGEELEELESGNEETLEEDQKEEPQSGREGTPKEGQKEQYLDGNTTENRQSENQTSQQLPHRLSSKRTHSITSVPEGKRIKFDDSVEFRDDYRSYLELNRSNKNYVPGRYAPPEEGYLDTSGSEISALKFTGMKKVKGGWIEVIPKEKKNKKGVSMMSSELQHLGSSEDATSQEGALTSQDDADRPKSGFLNPRAERLQRRMKRASGTDAVESGDNLSGGKSDMLRQQTKTSLDRSEDEISKPFREAAAVSPQKEARHDLSWNAGFGDVEEPFTGIHPVSKDHDAPEGILNLHPALPPFSDNPDGNAASHQRRKDGEAQISSVFTEIGRHETIPPIVTTQVENARPSSSATTSNESFWKENHDAHPCMQNPLSQNQDVGRRQTRGETINDPARMDNQKREPVLEGRYQPCAEGISEAMSGESMQQSPHSDISDAKRP